MIILRTSTSKIIVMPNSPYVFEFAHIWYQLESKWKSERESIAAANEKNTSVIECITMDFLF